MAKKDEKQEKRRFPVEDGKERKPWTEEQRKDFLTNADKLRPYVQHLITPAPAAKKKSGGFFDDLPVVE